LFASRIIENVRCDVPDLSDAFFGYVDFVKRLPDRYAAAHGTNDDDSFNKITKINELDVQLKYSASLQFHDWIWKLYRRLKKYQRRGIEVLDALVIDDGTEIREFSMP